LHLVNPTRSSIGGRTCVPSVLDIADAPDLAVVAVKADAVLQVLEDCGSRGVRFAIVFTSGFGETGEAGRQVEQQMRDIVARTGMRIYGPNCPGLNNINASLGFTFSPAFRLDRKAGPIGLATQGGGLGRTFVQAMERGVGTGLWCSAGNEADLEVSDFIHYMAGADDIRVIATCLEGIRNGPRFMEACLHAARHRKPVIAMKIGKSDYGRKAAQSHTAAITGSAEVNSAVFKELGVIEVEDIDELVNTASVMARGQPTGREKIAVYCFSGGTAALAADKVGSAGLTLSTFSDTTMGKLRAQLPSYAAMDNPVDTTADVLSKPEIGYETLKAVCEDPDVGLVLYPFPIEYGAVTTSAAASAVRVQSEVTTPIVPIWMSDKLGGGWNELVNGGLTPLHSVSAAVLSIARYVDHGRWKKTTSPDWRPLVLSTETSPTLQQEPPLTSLSEVAAKDILRAAGVDAPRSVTVDSADGARRAFQSLGAGPVAMKIVSAEILHKTDVGGVRLGISSEDSAASAYEGIVDSVKRLAGEQSVEGVMLEQMLEGPFVEVVVGIRRDESFGHLCTFGLGGVSVELFKDVSRRLLPISLPRAHAMIAETQCARLLEGHRGKPPMDVEALASALVRLSELVSRHSDTIEEIEVNPLAVRPKGQGVVALDAVISIRGKEPSAW